MSGWISVDSSMPERGVEVLVATRDGHVFVSWVHHDPDEIGWLFDHGRVSSWITHWMSIPEPPK